MDKYYIAFSSIKKIILEDTSASDLKKIKGEIEKYKLLNYIKPTELSIVITKDDVFSPKFYSDFSKVFLKIFDDYNFYENIKLTVSNDFRNNFFSEKEWRAIKVIDGFLKTKYGISIGFEDHLNTFTIKEVETANSKIDALADNIKSKNLSPLESLLSAYLAISSREYVVEEDGENYAMSRSIYGVANSNSCVCVGYSRWIMAVMSRLGLEDFKIYENSVFCTKDGVKNDGGHSNLIVYLKDEKYNIDGYYYMDPTWDRYFDTKKSPGIGFFMLPLGDIKNITNPLVKSEKFFTYDYNSYHRSSSTGMSDDDIAHNFAIVDDKLISFGGDTFIYSEEFLKDLFDKCPGLSGRILEKLNADELEIVSKNLELETKKDECITSIMESVQKIKYLTPNDLAQIEKFKEGLYKTGESEEILQFVQNMVEKYKNPDEKISQNIESILLTIKKDAILEFKNTHAGYSKFEFKKFEQGLQSQLDELKKQFFWDPNLAFGVTFDESAKRRFMSIAKLFGLSELVLNAKEALNKEMRVHVDYKRIFKEQKSIKYSIAKYQEVETKLLQTPNSKNCNKILINRIMKDYLGECKDLDDAIFALSAPIDFNQISTALSEVVGSGVWGYEDKNISVDTILSVAINDATYNYNENAGNSIIKKAKSVARNKNSEGRTC